MKILSYKLFYSKVQRFKGSKAQRLKGSKAQRLKGSKAQRLKGSKAQRLKGSKAQRLKGSKAQRLKGSKAQRLKGSKAQRLKIFKLNIPNMKKENSKLEGLTKLIKGNKNRIKKASFNSKNGFYLFVLAGSYACSSDSNINGSSLNLVGSDSVDFLGDRSSTSKQIVDAGGGDDVIITGAGDDVIRGGEGSDFIHTGAGNDTILIVGTTATDEYSSAEIQTTLSGVLSLDTLNANTVDEAASDIIDGGDGIDSLVIYGATDLTGTTITNIENISVHSTVTVDENTFDGSGVVLRGDGSSILVIEGDTSLTDVLGGINDLSGFVSLEIDNGAIVTITSPDEVNLLAEIGIVSGSGILTINGSESLNLAEVTVLTGLTVNGSHTNLSNVSTIDGTFSLEQGSTTNINTDAVNLADASTTTAGFSIENGQLLITDTSLTGRQLVSIDIEGVIETYAIVLPKLDIAPTQADFDGITFDELNEGVNLNLLDALSTALPNLDPAFVLTKATANNGTVNGFSYNSGDFSGTDTMTFTLTNVVTGEEFDFTADLAITAVNDDGIIQITGNRQQGETLTAELIDLDCGVEVLSYAWSQGAVAESESSFNIASSTDDLVLTITYRDAVNPNTDQTATITIAAEDILAGDIDTQITLNLEGDSTSGIVILEDSNNSDSFAGLTLGNPVNIATTLSYTTATISLVDDGGGEQIIFEYIIDTNNSEYIALDEGEELLDSITLTTTEGVSFTREFTVVGENDTASFSSGNVLTVNDSSGLDQGATQTQSYVISDADGIQQEDLVQNFGLLATSGTLDSEVIASTDLAVYGTLNVNSLTNELSFLKGEGVDALVENEVVVLTFSVESIDQTTLPVTVTINGGNESPVIVNEEVIIAEDSGLVVISVLDNDSDAEGDTLTVTNVTGVNNGTVSINQQNQLEYTANANFFGTETLSYTVSDGASIQTGTVTVSVTPVNDRGELSILGSSSVVRGSILSVTLTDIDGIDEVDVTLSLVDDNGDNIADFTPVVVEGSGDTATTTVVVPTSVAVGSEIVIRASYIDAGGVAYGTVAPFITTDSLTVSPNTSPTISGIIPTDIFVVQATASNIDLSSVEFADIDSDDLTMTITASTGTFTGEATIGITVSGSGTSEISLFGSVDDLNNYLETISNIEYTGASNIYGDNAATFTIVVDDGVLFSPISTVNLDMGRIFEGTPNDDTIVGTTLRDTLSGGDGNDTIFAGDSDNTLSNDIDNFLSGGTGNDTLHGGTGNDSLLGDEDDDTLIGSTGNDTLHGGTGNDTLYGESGNDILSGSTGVDTFNYRNADVGAVNIDTIIDFVSGEDKIDLSDVSALASSPTFATVSSTIEEGATLTDELLAYTNAEQQLCI